MKNATNEAINLFAHERAVFESKKTELLAEHLGKFALIHGTEIVGVFDTEGNALKVGYQRFGAVPLLIEPIIPKPQQHSAPALALGILTAFPKT